jgi:tetratricopeptide (TPR) repeat protein
MLQTRVWYDDYTLFGHAVRANPQSPAAWSNLGHRHMRDHQYAQAEGMFRRSIEARPDFWNGWRNLAASLVYQGRASEAIPIIEHLIEAQLGVEERYRLNVADDYNRLGALYLDLNRPADAIEPLRRAVELDPTHADARKNLDEALGLVP